MGIPGLGCGCADGMPPPGRPGRVPNKFFPATGNPADSPWNQKVSWQGTITKERGLRKDWNRRHELGADKAKVLHSANFLRHKGASRDSLRALQTIPLPFSKAAASVLGGPNDL